MSIIKFYITSLNPNHRLYEGDKRDKGEKPLK
jgi:hypothetical protein